MIGSPRIVGSCAFETDPAILCRVADRLGSSLVVASVMRSVRFGMKSVVDRLTVWATAWIAREFATAEAWSGDGHGVVSLATLTIVSAWQ